MPEDKSLQFHRTNHSFHDCLRIDSKFQLNFFVIISIASYMNFGNHSAAYQACSSVGSLSMVSVAQIRDEENLDYLENLCGFIDQMNLNPIWYKEETAANKLKVLEIYQTAINYSKNLSSGYQKQISCLENSIAKARQNNEEKEAEIRSQKERVQKLRHKYKLKKHKLYTNMYTNLKRKLEQEERTKRHRNDRQQSRYSTDTPEVVYYPVQPPPPHYYPPPPHMTPGHPNQYPSPYNPMGSGDPQLDLAHRLQDFLNFQQNQPTHIAYKGKEVADEHKKEVGVLGTKRTDQSRIMRPSEVTDGKAQSSLDSSEIIANHLSNNQAIQQSNSKKQPEDKRRPSIERSDYLDLPNLGEYSKKNEAQGDRKEELPSYSQKDQLQFDSIANINIKNKSGIDQGAAFQSKIHNSKEPNKLNPKIEPEEDWNLTLPDKSQVTKKPAPNLKVYSPNSTNIGTTNVQTSIFSSDQPKSIETVKMFDKPPIRASKQLIEQKTQSVDDSDELLHTLPGQSQIIKKPQSNLKGKEVNTSNVGATNLNKSKFSLGQSQQLAETPKKMFNQPPARASKQREPTQDDIFGEQELVDAPNAGHGRQGVKEEDFGAIKNSNIDKRGKGKKQQTTYLAVPHSAPAATTSQNNTPSHHRYLEDSPRSHKDQTAKDQTNTAQNYADIYKSNFGNKDLQNNNNEAPPQKMLKAPPPRSSQQKSALIAESAKQQNLQQSAPAAKEEPDYADDFDEFGNFDLKHSKVPSHKKDGSTLEVKPEEEQQQRTTEKKPTIRIDPSRVNIDVSSMQSISEKSKYFRLIDEEFKPKLKDNIFGKTEKSQSMAPEMEDTFDFMDTIPANSVIAKRPLLQSHIAQKSKQLGKSGSVSIKNIQGGQNLGDSSSGGNISIHLITHDNKNEKILSRNQYEKVIEQEENEESSLIKKNLRESDLPVAPNVLYSREPEKELRESGLPSEIFMKSKVTSSEKKTSLLDLNSPPANSINDRKNSVDINLEIEEELNPQDNKTAASISRNKVLMMLQNFDRSSLVRGSSNSFPDALLKQTLKKYCQIGQNDKSSIEQLKKKTLILQQEIGSSNKDIEAAKKRLEKLIREDGIKLQTPPKLGGARQNDSLLYSGSYYEPSKKAPILKQQIPEGKDALTESLDFNHLLSKKQTQEANIPKQTTNPYTPVGDPSRSQNRDSPKGANRFLLENVKTMGGKEKQQLLKNAGEGILKFDKDDILNSEVVNLVKKNKTEEQEYEDDDEWGE